LTLVVTAPDLRAGQGYVRCGRCANVFNALVNLSDGGIPHNVAIDTAATPAPATARLETPAPIEPPAPVETPRPVTNDDIAMPDIGAMPTFEAEIVEPVIADGELEFHPEKTSVSDIFVNAPHDSSDISSGTFESIVLEGDPSEVLNADSEPLPQALALPPPDPPIEPAPEAVAEPSLEFDLDIDRPASSVEDAADTAATPPPVDDLSAVKLSPPDEQAAASGSSTPRVRVAQPEPVFPDAEAIAERFIERKQTERMHKLMQIGSIVLAVFLAAQLLHQSRRTLAASDIWGKPVRALYGAFNIALAPDWNVAAYDVRQLGAETEPGDATRLIVRASIRNAATRTQPIPLLRLTLQDRYGNAIATRDLQPAEYLPEASRDMTELAADERLDTEIRVVDASRAAIGFEIDACLPTAGGVLVCANDARRRLQAATR
jgi:hypothetical protein